NDSNNMRVLCFFCCWFGLLQAQTLDNPLDTFASDPIPILVEPLRYPTTASLELVQWLETKLYTTLEDHWHFQVVNHSREENLGVVDPEYIFQLSLGPIIDDIFQSEKRDTSGQLLGIDLVISSGVQFNLRVTNIQTGELKYAREIKSTVTSRGFKNPYAGILSLTQDGDGQSARVRPLPPTPAAEAQLLSAEKDRLFDLALKRLPRVWNDGLNRVFPVACYVTDITEGSAQKPTAIRINAGSSMGIKARGTWECYTAQVYEAMGEVFVYKKVIAYFSPRKIATHSTSGSVYSGRKELGEALRAGQKVFCRPLAN
ncbi:MAG: hypothetical protein AAGJ82_10720, partial [Bacteroidota bacterium]